MAAITSVRWRGHFSPQSIEIGARLAFVDATYVPSAIAEWLARIDRIL